MEIRKFKKLALIFVLFLTAIIYLAWPTSCNNIGLKRVVILSSSFNLRYIFLLPLTASIWKRLGVHPIILLIGDEEIFETNLQTKETLKFLEEMNASIYYFQPKRLSPTSFSQMIRLFGAVLQLSKDLISDKTIIISSDADLAVFNLSNHIPQTDKNKTIHLYNSNCCEPVNVPPQRGNYVVKMYPMGTIGATKRTWTNIMGFTKAEFNVDEIEDYIENEFGKSFFSSFDDKKPELVGSPIWYADQSLFSYKFDEWIKNPSNRMLISKHSNSPRRIDRKEWPTPDNFTKLNINSFDDAHLLAAAYSDKEWKQLFSFIEFAFINHTNMQHKFEKYRRNFCKFLSC